MQIEIPEDAEMLTRGQAAAAGFDSVDEYITNLIRHCRVSAPLSSEEALADLGRLRLETPKMTAEEIVGALSRKHESRKHELTCHDCC